MSLLFGFLNPFHTSWKPRVAPKKTRTTIGHLVRFETFVRKGFLNGEHVVSIFFDADKAYDTTWKCGFLKDLHEK